MKRADSFHIYDRRTDYSFTNIRDILFDVLDPKPWLEAVEDATTTVENEEEPAKLRTSASHVSLIGKGGCGVRHFVTVNLALAYGNIMMNSMSFVVAIPAMLNHTAIKIHVDNLEPDGPFDWPNSYIFISAIVPQLGFAVAALPAAILAKRCGAKYVMGAGLLIQSLFQMMIPAAAQSGFTHFVLLLLGQNIAMAPLLPCTYMLLSNWIPPCERSRMVAIFSSVVPIVIVIVHYLGTAICQCELCGGWAAHFYFFSTCSVLLSMFFVFFMWEDPDICPVISDAEKDYIQNELSNYKRHVPAQIPWKRIVQSGPCWALWISDIGQSIYITTVVIVFPFYILQVLNNSQEFDFLKLLLPGALMVASGLLSGLVADCLIMRSIVKPFAVRKSFNSLALFGAAVGLSVVSHTGCDYTSALVIHNISALLNGVHSSGFSANYLEVSHNFIGILVSIGKSLAVIFCSLWIVLFGYLTLTGKSSLRKWQLMFFIDAVILALTATAYVVLGSGYRQNWDQTSRFSGVKNRYSVTFTQEVASGTSANVKTA